MCRTFLLMATITAACLAQPAPAELKHYRVVVDEFSNTPGVSPSFELHPEQFTGQAIVRDGGGGSPELVNLRIHLPFKVTILKGSVGQMPFGYFWRAQSTDHAAPSQSGTGSTSTTVDWGPLVGWAKTGFAFCQETPASLLNVLCPFVGWVGGVTLVPSPSFASAYDTGVWTFASDMSTFNSAKFMYQTFVGATNNTQWRLRGELVQIPALPLLGAGALGAALVYLGVRAIRGR